MRPTMIALTWEEENEQLVQLFGQYKRLRGGHSRARDPLERMRKDEFRDFDRYRKRRIKYHIHTCIDGLCTPRYCYQCLTVYCEPEFTTNSRAVYTCDRCIDLQQSLRGYHINGCNGCLKHTCMKCKRTLCVQAFPMVFRKRIITSVCSDCLDTKDGEFYKESFQRYVDYCKQSAQQKARRTYENRKDAKLSEETRMSVKQIFDFRCAACHRKEEAVRLAIDHVVPIVKGGSPNPENLQVLCSRCNSLKATEIIDYRTPKQIAKLNEL